MSGIESPARAQYNDFLGTAAADESDSGVSPEYQSIEDTIGLDMKRWWVLGVTLARWEGFDMIDVLALDRTAHAVRNVDDLRVQQEPGPLPVTRFRMVETPELKAFVDRVFRRLTVRLWAQTLADADFAVTDLVPWNAEDQAP